MGGELGVERDTDADAAARPERVSGCDELEEAEVAGWCWSIGARGRLCRRYDQTPISETLDVRALAPIEPPDWQWRQLATSWSIAAAERYTRNTPRRVLLLLLLAAVPNGSPVALAQTAPMDIRPLRPRPAPFSSPITPRAEGFAHWDSEPTIITSEARTFWLAALWRRRRRRK